MMLLTREPMQAVTTVVGTKEVDRLVAEQGQVAATCKDDDGCDGYAMNENGDQGSTSTRYDTRVGVCDDTSTSFAVQRIENQLS